MYVVLSLFSIFIFSSLLKFGFYYLPKHYMPMYSFLIFLSGGLSYSLTNYFSPVHHFFNEMNQLDAHGIIDIFLPLLIFNSSFNMNFHVFWNIKHIALSLAGPFLILIASLYSFTYYAIYATNFNLLIPIFIKGFILSATDPIAIVSCMKHMGAPKPLEMIIEGESLLNDGISLFLFSFFVDIYNYRLTLSQGFKDFFFSVVISPLVGIAFGYLVRRLIGHTRKDPMIEYSIVLSFAYFNCVLLEKLGNGLSGVLSTVGYGLYLSYKGKYNMSPEIEKKSETIFNFLGEMLEIIIYFLSGYICMKKLWENYEPNILSKIVVSYLLINIYRILVICGSYIFFRNNDYKLNFKSFFFVGFSAVRGAITLSMGLLLHQITMIDENSENNWTTEYMIVIFGVVILSFLINGLFAVPLYKYLKLDGRKFFGKNDYEKLKSHLNRLTSSKISELKGNLYHKNSDWQKIYKTIFFGKFNERRVEWDNESSPGSDRNTYHIIMSNHHNNFLHSVYHQYWVDFEANRINKIAITYLLEAVENALDHCEHHADEQYDIFQYEYNSLEKIFKIPRAWSQMLDKPIIGKIFNLMIYNRLYLCYRIMGAFISVHKKVCDKYIKMDNQFTEEYLPFINRYEEKFEHKLNGFIERFPEISQKIFTRESMKKVNQMKREEIKNLLGEGVVPQNLGKKFLSKIDNELKMIKSM